MIDYGIFVIGFLSFALWRASTQFLAWLRRFMTTAGAEIESVEGSFITDLISLIKRMVNKVLGLRLLFRRRRKLKALPPELASVHHIYLQLLNWLATGGWPRSPSQTPFEYLYSLEGLLPVPMENLHFITQQYVSTRYGLSAPTDEELRQLRHSWSQLKHNRIKKLGKERLEFQEEPL